MAASFSKTHHLNYSNSQFQDSKTSKYPSWYSPESGIYTSKHPPMHLPANPFLDVVSFIFSHTHNGNQALIDSPSGFSISYSELLPLVKSTAGGLHKMGVSQGDVVLILLPNSIYFPVVFLSVLCLGGVVTTMNPRSSFSEVKKQTLGCHVKFAFTLVDRVDELRSLGVSCVGVPENVYSDSKQFRDLISGDSSLVPSCEIRQQDTAVILYSSGTTGTCKGVLLTHGNLIAMVQLFVRFEASQYEDLGSENVYLAVLPMFHVYGLSLFAMGLLSLGTSIVVMRKFNADEMVRAIEKYGVTHFPGVPPLVKILVERAKGGCMSSLKSLKQVSSGAAPLSTRRLEDFIQTLPHVDFIQGYGLSESAAVGTRGFNSEELQNYSSVGLLAPNMQAKVVDCVTGFFVPPGRMGELWLRGPGVMKGYLNNVDATSLAIDRDGWLRTGDIVYFDQDGYLYIVDRLKEIIKYKGFQIAPADLEDVLVSHQDILDAAVTGARDEEAGEIPVAFVVKRTESSISREDVIDYVAKQVAPYKKVREVVFTKSIPRSPAGKILRRELRSNFASRL